MAKNIIVVDEQGNEYEATYPKRAKGLVKNGRARFVEENKICLVCPPEDILEDNKMSDKLNKQQVFDQIVDLQKQLNYFKDVLFQIQTIDPNQTYTETQDGETLLLDYMPEVALAKVQVIQEVAASQVAVMNKMLDFYLTVYKQLEESDTKE